MNSKEHVNVALNDPSHKNPRHSKHFTTRNHNLDIVSSRVRSYLTYLELPL